MNQFDGICIQLGLYRTADYISLSRPNFNKNDPKAVIGEHDYPAFKELGVDRYQYIGVDCCPVSIQHMYKSYTNEIKSGEAEFVLSYVSGASGEMANFLYDFDYNDPMCVNWWTTSTLGFGDLLNSYYSRFAKIDLVVMDIEGVELSVFQDYDFSIRPRFMEIELHEVAWENETVDGFIDKMTKHDYECVSRYMESDRLHAIEQALFRDIRRNNGQHQ